MKKAVLALSAIVLAACQAPGQPMLRTSVADGEGELISGCQNVSSKAAVNHYETGYYLTTWGSAWKEGSSAGLQEGLSGQGPAYDAVSRGMIKAVSDEEPVFDSMYKGPKPFCRAYAASRREVAEAVATILPTLGNPIRISDIDRGIFQTDWTDRSHMAAKWKDGYVITVTEERPNRVVVRVLRSVYISRQGAPYFLGDSVGQNESFVLTKISQAVAD